MLAVFEGYSPQAGLEQGGGEDPVKGCRHHLGVSDSFGGGDSSPSTACGRIEGSRKRTWASGGIGAGERSLLKVRRL